jgi:hypothetical protein
MKKQKAKIAYFTIPPFFWDVMVQRGGTLQECEKKFFKRCGVDAELTPEENKVDGRVFWLENRAECCVWLRAGAGTRILTHEVFHIVAWLMRGIQCPMGKDSEELAAYLSGFISGEIVKRVF